MGYVADYHLTIQDRLKGASQILGTISKIKASPKGSLFFMEVAILFLEVMAVCTTEDVLPPHLIVKIPLNGLLDAGIEVILRFPIQFRLDLRWIDGIA